MNTDIFASPAVPLLVELEQQGFSLQVTADGRLRVEPGSRLSDQQRQLLAAHRDAAVLLLRTCDAGVVARREAFRAQLEADASAIVPAFVFRPDAPYAAGVCFSCADSNGSNQYGRCWRCALAWRLACRVPIDPALAVIIDAAKRVA